MVRYFQKCLHYICNTRLAICQTLQVHWLETLDNHPGVQDADNICKRVMFVPATLISPPVCELILSSNCGKTILSCKSFLHSKHFTSSPNICLCSKLVVPNSIETLKCIVGRNITVQNLIIL